MQLPAPEFFFLNIAIYRRGKHYVFVNADAPPPLNDTATFEEAPLVVFDSRTLGGFTTDVIQRTVELTGFLQLREHEARPFLNFLQSRGVLRPASGR